MCYRKEGGVDGLGLTLEDSLEHFEEERADSDPCAELDGKVRPLPAG